MSEDGMPCVPREGDDPKVTSSTQVMTSPSAMVEATPIMVAAGAH
jgi:hypothetical protein